MMMQTITASTVTLRACTFRLPVLALGMTDQGPKGYSVFVADKIIGRNKPVIVICYNASGLHQWNGRWVVITDDFIQASMSRHCDLRSDGEHVLSDFLNPQMFIDQLRGQAEGHFNLELHDKHPALWKDLFSSSQPPKFIELTPDEEKTQIFRLAFFSETVALAILDHFSKVCGISEVTKMIEAGRKFKIDTGL
jgi:hypothetical protein